MVDFVKRHLFLIALAAGVFVIGLLLFVFIEFGHRGANSDMAEELSGSLMRVRGLSGGTLYNQDVVEALKAGVDERKQRYEATLKYIAQRGRERKVLVDGVFPTTTDTSLLHSCKAEYKAALDRFMARLGAVDPTLSADATEAQKMAKRDEMDKATMLAHPLYTFYRPDWVDKAEAPNLELVRYGQENVWLMEDLVEIVAKLNEDHIGQRPRSIGEAAVKELLEIRIGSDAGSLDGSKGGGARYRSVVGAGSPREQTLSGRGSRPGFSLVLPWRMIVVADSRTFGELVRRLKDRETFITVDGVLVEPITEASFGRVSKMAAASELKVYGSADRARDGDGGVAGVPVAGGARHDAS